MADDYHRSQYRIPNPLYEKLLAAAAQNKRSLNAEMVLRLEASFKEIITTNYDEQFDLVLRRIGEAEEHILIQLKTYHEGESR